MEYFQIILEKLLQTAPGAVSAGQDEIRMICPVCKNQKAKLYVGLHRLIYQTTGQKKLAYGCKHCNYTGIVGVKFLKQFGIQLDENLSKSLQFHKEVIKSVHPISKMEKLDVKIPNFIRPEDKFKLDYLSKRLGRHLTLQDLKTYKIILNFKDFYDYNKLDLFKNLDPNDPEYNKKSNYLTFIGNEFTEHFVGMLSVDNNKINLRNINSEALKNKRYMVHVIDKNIGNPYMYMVDVPIDLLTQTPTINIAEGNYDIIGAKELFHLNEDYSNVFVAIGTRTAYKRALDQLLKMTGFFNANVNIYADNDSDTDLNWYKDMLKDYKEVFNKITILYNKAVDENGKACKDFGDLSKPVKVEMYEI